jgi:tRNA splicing endonuclease
MVKLNNYKAKSVIGSKMVKDVIVEYINGKAYAVKVSTGIAEKMGLKEGKEIPKPILLHLVYTGVAEVYDDKGYKLSFDDLVKVVNDIDTFTVFMVLHDLVKKGKKVCLGDNPRELLLLSEKARVLVIDEDSYITAEDLYNQVEKAIKQETRLIIAVVDVNGEITYYEVNKMDFPRIERR